MVGKNPSPVLATTEHTCCPNFEEVIVCSLPPSVLGDPASSSWAHRGKTRDRLFQFLCGLSLAEEGLGLFFHLWGGLAVDDEEEVVFDDELDIEETPNKEAAGTNPEDVEMVVVPKDVTVVVSCVEN